MPAVSDSLGPVSARSTARPSASAQTGAELLPETDTLWCDVYHVVALLAERDGVRWWRAHRTDTAEEVVLRVAPGACNDARAPVWERLCELELSHLQRAREAIFTADHRVEISDALRGTPLDAWRAARPAIEPAQVEALVRQMAEALGVLHASGLVHTGLWPGAIFVREDKDRLHFTLGALESAIPFEGERPVALPVDPRYAPPEAVGLELHDPGTALCAWDWWALGRIVQELTLGRHIAATLPETSPGESIAARAEALLWERDPAGPRAGAVELMPAPEARVQILLRGLLASAPEVRWNGDFVDRWLRQMPTKEEYDVRRIERKFRWRGRLWTVPAAARELRSAEGWPEAARHLFERDTPDTLAHFLARSPDHQKLREQLDATLKLAETEPWCSLPPEIARELLLAVALLQLAGGDLVWRGRRIEGATLHGLLADEAEHPERLAFVRALTHRNLTAVIERQDFKIGRSLAEIGRVAAEAEAFLLRHGWLKAVDAADSERLFRLALEPATLLQADGLGLLRRDFACTSQPAVDRVFQNAQPARSELVALAWGASRAAEFGFVTHAAWQTQQAAEWRARADRLMNALAWVRLGRALGAGPLVFCARRVWLATWVAVAVIFAVVWPGPQWLPLAFLPGALALAARWIGTVAGGAELRRYAPAAPPWRWRDDAARCERELGALKEYRDGAALENALAEIETEVAKLTLAKAAPAACPPRFAGVRACGVAGWIVLAGALALGGWRGVTNPPSGAAWLAAWWPAAEDDSSDSPGGGAKVAWPYRPRSGAQVMNVEAVRPATRAEQAGIRERGRALAAPYRPETIGTLLIFRVTRGERNEVAIFDSQGRTPADDRIYTLERLPLAHAWIEVAGRKGIFLDPETRAAAP